MPNTPPNLVFVFPDQMRGSALGFSGEEPVLTPVLDQFARQSLYLPNAISNYPVCSPYRGMLMTGMYPFSNRVISNCTDETEPYNVELQQSARCWSDILKAQGYALGYIGKWHLESPRPPYIACRNNIEDDVRWNEWTPPERRHGFDFWYAYNTYDYHMRPMYWSTHAAREDFHFVEQWGPEHETDLAIQYLQNAGGQFRDPQQPFALVVSMNPPHMPYEQVPEEYVARYNHLSVHELAQRPNIPAAGTWPGNYYRGNIRNYYAMITGVDEQFGRILQALDEQGLSENTLVVFTSDHGNCLGIHERISKMNAYEESLRVPFLIRWPAQIAARQDALLLSAPDIYPTLLELMGFGAEIPPEVEGTSFARLFLGGEQARPSSALYLKIPFAQPEQGERGLRSAQYTFVQRKQAGQPDEVSLFDNLADPYQLENIAGQRPELVAELTRELHGRLAQTHDPWLKNEQKQLTPFQFVQLAPNLYVYQGAVNTGILQCGERAVLIDCDDSLSQARLAELGITQVERIYCTQHRRPNTAGCAAFAAAVFAPQAERQPFEAASAYWQDPRNRWHLYHFRPGSLAPLFDIALSGTVREGDAIEWGGFHLRVLETPGMTDGAVSYQVETAQAAEQRIIFSGDVLYGAGQVWDVHSLQAANGGIGDYHGFLGATPTLRASLNKLGASGATCLVPSHGDLMHEPAAAAQLTGARLEQLYRNYAAISALNFYFPAIFQELRADPWRMAPAPTLDFPAFIRPVTATSFAICSDSGALFLIDCGDTSVLETLAAWKEEGQFTRLEGCWITHYHDDHVDALQQLAAANTTPIYADQHLVEILEQPARFDLPCLSPAAVPVTVSTRHAQTWQWHEFELTALHFPGQTYYHGGLLVRGHGVSALLCGDSFAPSGLDDYTAGNRNFLGAGQGYRRCIDLIRQYRPDFILNQHQQKAFHFSDEQLAYMEQLLIQREALLAELLPWENPNFGSDPGWLRAYPYEVQGRAGGTCVVEVRATNHAGRPLPLSVEAVLPPGWQANGAPVVAACADESLGEALLTARIAINIPEGTEPGSYPLPMRVTLDGRYLGQVCHAMLTVERNTPARRSSPSS